MTSFMTLTTLLAVVAGHAAAQPPPDSNPAKDAGCTTTSVITQTSSSTYPFWPQCEFDGIDHIYPSTVTATSSVDCHGCQHIQVHYTPMVNCPLEKITATATETTPSTVHKTVCLATAACGA